MNRGGVEGGRDHARWVLPLTVFAAVLVNCTLWACKIPFMGAPDEFEHYAVVRFVAAHGRLPLFGEGDFRTHLMDATTKQRVPERVDPQTGRLTYRADLRHFFEFRPPFLFRTPTTYLLAGGLSRLLGGFSLARARLFGSLCIALAALLVYATGLVIRPPRRDLAALAALGFGFWPQIAFIGAYVNEDAYAVLAAAALLAACAWAERGPLDRRRLLALGVALGLIGQAKINAWGALPIAAAWGLAMLRRRGVAFLRFAAPAALIGVLLSCWWLLRNAALYHGDALCYRLTAELGDHWRRLPPELAARTLPLGVHSLQSQGASLGAMLAKGWTATTLKSFFGAFGWMKIWLPAPIYWAALALVAGGLAASFAALRRREDLPVFLAPVGFALPLFLVLLALSMWNSFTYAYQPQGRYLLACTPALLLQIVLIGGGARRPGGAALAWATTGFLIAANAFAFVRCLG